MGKTRTPVSSWFVKARRAASVDDYETWVEGGVCPTLNAFDNATETRATVVMTSVAYGITDDETVGINLMPTMPIPSSTGGGHPPAVSASNVRRLTPVECERLQGFPDNWTASQSDSARYRQMGNAVTVNVAAYVGWLIDTTVRQSA